MEKPLVSIIIPVYNVEKYLPQCLDSVLAQTYTNIEVICVNDGSPDNSIVVLRKYENEDSRIRVLEIKNHGLSYARNIGTTETVKVAVENAYQSDVDLVLWNYSKEYSDHSIRVNVFNKRAQLSGEAFNHLYQQLIGLTGSMLRYPAKCDSISTAWGKLYKRSIIQENSLSFVDTSIIGTEDLLFNAEYFSYCKTAMVLPDCFNHYRKQNADSLARRYKPLLLQQWTELHRRLKNVCSEKEFLNQSHSNRIALSLIGLGINVMDSPDSIFQKYKELDRIISLPHFRQALAKIERKFTDGSNRVTDGQVG